MIDVKEKEIVTLAAEILSRDDGPATAYYQKLFKHFREKYARKYGTKTRK